MRSLACPLSLYLKNATFPNHLLRSCPPSLKARAIVERFPDFYIFLKRFRDVGGKYLPSLIQEEDPDRLSFHRAFGAMILPALRALHLHAIGV